MRSVYMIVESRRARSKRMLDLHLGEDVGNCGVRVRLGVEHHEGNSSSSNEENGSNDDNSNSPGWQQGINVDNSLLISVREVVVSGVHVMESSGEVHLDNSSIESLVSSIQLSAVSRVSFSISLVFSSSLELSLSLASLLVKVLESESKVGILQEDSLGVRLGPCLGNWDGVPCVVDLGNVGSIGLGSSFSGVTSGVLVASSPLEVNVISESDVKVLRNKVVLGGWVCLDNISSLSSDIQVVQSSG